METETLYCIKGHTYDQKWRNPGDEVEVRRRHSGVLIALGRMSREPTNVIPFPLPPKTDTQPHAAPIATQSGDNANKSPEDAKAALRAEYKALFGKDAAGRMSVDRLREEISKKKGESE